MAELNGRYCALTADEISDPAVGAYMSVGVYAGTFVGLAATFFYRGFFGEDDPGATYCVFSQGHKVAVGRTATLRFVLAHRRNDDAVAGENSRKAIG